MKSNGYPLRGLKFGLESIFFFNIMVLSQECMFLGSLSHHNKDLEQRTLKPLARHSSQVLDKLCYSS